MAAGAFVGLAATVTFVVGDGTVGAGAGAAAVAATGLGAVEGAGVGTTVGVATATVTGTGFSLAGTAAPGLEAPGWQPNNKATMSASEALTGLVKV